MNKNIDYISIEVKLREPIKKFGAWATLTPAAQRVVDKYINRGYEFEASSSENNTLTFIKFNNTKEER